MKKQQAGILSIDVGGSHLKADVLDEKGKSLAERVRVPTPKPCPPDLLVKLVTEMVTGLPAFDRISIGFPAFNSGGRAPSLKLKAPCCTRFAIAVFTT